MSRLYRPNLILVDREVVGTPHLARVMEGLGGIETVEIDRAEIKHYFGADRHTLYLTANRGRFLKWCPARKPAAYACCGLRTVDLAEGCPLGCGYCILQAIETRSFITAYVNLETLINELCELFQQSVPGGHRICTGELTDSLALEHILHHGPLLVPFFAEQTNAILELKTKTDHIEPLMGLEPRGRTVVSFSVNPPPLDREEELRTARFSERVLAAARLAAAGYRTGFHFDPLILHEGWHENYSRSVDEIFDRVPAASIAWISLGTLRLPPALLTRLRATRPKSAAVLAELHPGFDGNLRYLRPIRREMYTALESAIRVHSKSVPIYLCMEPREVTSPLGLNDKSEESLNHALTAPHGLETASNKIG